MTSADRPLGGERPVATHGLERLRPYTPARIALGRAGTAQPTAASLRFMLDHARARDAVHTALDFMAIERSLQEQNWSVLRLHSAAADRTEYLRRPDLGRLLAPRMRVLIDDTMRGSDVAIVVADGLSALAVERNLLPVLNRLRPLLAARRLKIGPVVLVEQGRVAIGDEIGELLDVKLVAVLVGERPGLSAADSLGAYITWRPRPATMDSSRNCVSNIRAVGLPPEEAASQIDELIGQAFAHAATGLRLKDLRCGAAAISAIAGR